MAQRFADFDIVAGFVTTARLPRAGDRVAVRIEAIAFNF